MKSSHNTPATRPIGWSKRLNQVIRRFESSHGLRWGLTDCASFTAECVLAVTGRDYKKTFPVYSNAGEADAIIEDHPDLAALVDRCLPRTRTPRPGDVALIKGITETGRQPMLGIVLVHFVAIPAGHGGLCYFRLKHIETAWRV